MTSLFVLPHVWPVLLESAEWYEAEHSGIGVQLLRAVKAQIAEIKENPLRFPAVYRDARRAQVPRFAYGIFYVCRHDRVYVFAIVHLSRDPKHWKKLVPPKDRRLP